MIRLSYSSNVQTVQKVISKSLEKQDDTLLPINFLIFFQLTVFNSTDRMENQNQTEIFQINR